MLQTESGFAPVEGGQLYYEVSGAGFPLVLIHAGVADSRMWDEQVAEFGRFYRVIRYDTRGFGLTRTEPVSFSNRQDLADLLDHLGVAAACVLGLSRGGQIAVDFTLEFPERVAALIPVAAGLGGYQGELTEAELRQSAEMEALWEKKDFIPLADLEVRYWCDGPGQAEGRCDASVRERVRAMILNNYTTQTVEPQPRPLDPPAAGRLAEIRVPTLVIVGDLDESSVLAMADAMSQGIEGGRKVVFPGVAHMVNMERPAEFNRVVLEFLQSLSPHL